MRIGGITRTKIFFFHISQKLRADNLWYVSNIPGYEAVNLPLLAYGYVYLNAIRDIKRYMEKYEMLLLLLEISFK
jgi:hypothetical protein